ncbi:MAG: hypothetical protein DRI48_08375, partial [Chloroflexi bacterium]
MTTPIDKLTKILRLETEKYKDQAVVGGLKRYTNTWLQEARAAYGPEAAKWIKEIGNRLRAYSSLPNPTARREALTTLFQ